MQRNGLDLNQGQLGHRPGCPYFISKHLYILVNKRSDTRFFYVHIIIIGSFDYINYSWNDCLDVTMFTSHSKNKHFEFTLMKTSFKISRESIIMSSTIHRPNAVRSCALHFWKRGITFNKTLLGNWVAKCVVDVKQTCLLIIKKAIHVIRDHTLTYIFIFISVHLKLY